MMMVLHIEGLKGLVSKVLDVGIVVFEEFVEDGTESTLKDGGFGVFGKGLERLGNVKADIGDRVACHLDDNGQNGVCNV